LKQTCEVIIENQNSYIKWLVSTRQMNRDDLIKFYYNIDSQAIKIASQFYSDRITSDYIRFQTIAVDLCTDRLKYNISVGMPAVQLQPITKTYHNACENLLLSLRTEENYDVAKMQLLKIFKFFKNNEQEQETEEIEWIVTNWCKIKRDMWKSKAYNYTKEDKQMTIVDLCNVSPHLVFQYLFEELKYYSIIRYF
jgi:hypothetical protein